MRRLTFLLGISLACSCTPQAPAEDARPVLDLKDFKPADTSHGWPLLFHDDFEDGTADGWLPTDAKAWRVDRQGDNHVYSQFKKQSNFKPAVRSPFNRSIVKDLHVGNCVLDVRLQSTHEDYGHRDMCLFFGVQDDSHLYYVHFGKKADDHANQIFIVDGAPRKKISITSTDGTNWNDDWHHARVVRDVKSGRIDVYFDDMDKPAMTAVDKTFAWGRVGVGSFDDTGNFDHVLVYGEKATPPKSQ